MNYYLTSERLLDERLELNPPPPTAATIATVTRRRGCPASAEGLVGPRELLREAWERYQIPIAVTEVHNGCTREEQLRWLLEVWDGAREVRAGGVTSGQ